MRGPIRIGISLPTDAAMLTEISTRLYKRWHKRLEIAARVLRNLQSLSELTANSRWLCLYRSPSKQRSLKTIRTDAV